MDRLWEVRLSGTGGQGIVLAGIILAEAAVLEGLNVVQSQVYGPESRGGASRAEVIISREAIRYPKVTRPDVVLAMSQEAANRYAGSVREGGLLVVDQAFVARVPEVKARVVPAPVTRVARERLGREIVASTLAIALLVGLTEMVGEEALRAAVRGRAPRGTVDLNLRAVETGLEMAGNPEFAA